MKKDQIIICSFGICKGSDCSHTSDEPPRDEVETCKRWLELYACPSRNYTRGTSYGFKHSVEKMTRYDGRYQYIGNGSFIKAALEMGYECQPTDVDSPNAFFKLRVLGAWRERQISHGFN